MDLQVFTKKAREFSKPFRVTRGDKFRLKDVDPGDTLDLRSEDKPRAKEALAEGVEVLARLQDMLYAQDHWAVLLIFQAMDAAGKDGAIKHVMSGDQPAGLPGLLVQGAHQRGPRPRLSLAVHEVPARTRATSASSIAATTRRRWWCGSIRSSWSGNDSRSTSSRKASGRNASRISEA